MSTRTKKLVTTFPLRLKAAMRSACWWVAGTCKEDMALLPLQAQMQYTTVGFAMLLNLAFLLASWSAVGFHYLGVFGLVIPGIVVPCLFVLGLDRLIAMGRRRLVGDLAAWETLGKRRVNLERWFRVGLASVFSAVTTFTLMLALSASSIHTRQLKDANYANESLRRETEERVSGSSRVVFEQSGQRLDEIGARRPTLQAKIASSEATLNEVETRSRAASEEMAREEGGLGRVGGIGKRFEAQRKILATNDSAVQAKRAELVLLRDQLATLDAEAAQLRELRARTRASMAAQSARAEAEMKLSSRYIAPQDGLFSDATTFISLYSDKQEGTGRWWLSMLLSEFLFAVECAALLAIKLNPESALDVRRRVQSQRAAAAFQAEAAVDEAKGMARPPRARGRSEGPARSTAQA